MSRSRKHAKKRRGRPLEIAIVGMGCRFPGSEDVGAYWKNIHTRRDCTGPVPSDRWDSGVFYDPANPSNDRVTCERGGFLASPIPFDPARHGVMPLAVEGGEPEQFLVLETARAALEDAGYADGLCPSQRVEVVVGRGNYFNRGNLTRLQHGRIVAQTLGVLRALHPEWTEADLDAVRADLKSSLPPFEAGTVAAQLTNSTSGRVADRLDFSGVNYVVDAASASSLVAVDLAARSLVEGRCDVAVVGGVYVAVDVDFYQVFSLLDALSRSGQAQPFGAGADGMIPGEGVGVVVLKRRADAEAAGDRIYALIQGVGLSSDGRGAGLAAPSAKGHARAMRRAYRQAGIDPATVELVEGHGLGVPAADRAELRALRAVFPRPERGKRTLGAVSSIIGHAMPAAGMAALIKTALALHHRVLPPTGNGEMPHPLLADDSAPFALGKETRPWIHGDRSHPRRAGVNAFGFAGVNGHAVLEEHAPSADGVSAGWLLDWETEAILLSAPDRQGLIARLRDLASWLSTGRNAEVSLKDLAATLNCGQTPQRARVGLVVASVDDLRARLDWLLERLADPACTSIRDARGTFYWDAPFTRDGGKVALLYPGEGGQYRGMLADLCPHFPELRRVLDTADRIALERKSPQLPSELLYGETAAEDGLWAIESAVNVVLSAQWGVHHVLMSLGITPDVVAGHSSGEILALAAAGVIRTDEDLENRLGALGALFGDLEAAGKVPSAKLLAIAAPREKVEAALRELGLGEQVIVAMDNCPHQVVVAGGDVAVDSALSALRGRGLLCEVLPFDRAYHTPAFGATIEPIRAFFDDVPIASQRLPIYTCATAGPMPNDLESMRILAVDQWVRPVQFRATIEALHAAGVRVFVEVGARGNLTGYVDDILRNAPHFAISASIPRRSGVTQLNHLVAALYAQGVALRPDALYTRRRPKPVDLTRNMPDPRPVMELKLGFPEMRVSPDLVERLARRFSPQPEPSPAFALLPELETYSNGNGKADVHTNGHVGRNGKPCQNGDARRLTHATPVSPEPATPPPPLVPVAVDDRNLVDYFATMDHFLETQRVVLEAYLGSAPAGTVSAPNSVPDVPTAAPTVPSPVPTPAPAEVVAVASPAVDVRAVLLDQVTRRTGYPLEMLDLSYDMEGDLGIDSIKRVEIFGELQNLGLVPDSVDIEKLSRSRTLGDVLKLLENSPRNEPTAPPSWWPGTVEHLQAGVEFVGTWPLDRSSDPVAEHHTLGGRRISILDPTMRGLPLLPFTIMAEMLAQAASVLVPGRLVAALQATSGEPMGWLRGPADPG
ncbi:MAG: beta-ketoacyl synthase N-terminal-like domain-containing protein [Isosphaeraceae bacterium]